MEEFTLSDLEYINEPFNLQDKLYILKMNKEKYGMRYSIKTPEEKKEYHKKYMQKRREKMRQQKIISLRKQKNEKT